jgi:hypothetical protein
VQTGEGSVKVETSEPKGNLEGFLARLHGFGAKRRQKDGDGETVPSGAVIHGGKNLMPRHLTLNPVGYRQVTQRNRGRLDNGGRRLTMYKNLV